VTGIGPHSADVTLPGRPVHDFALTDLGEAGTGHTLTGSADSGYTDRWTLTGGVGPVPPDVSSLTFDAGRDTVFAPTQSGGCHLGTHPADGREVVCPVSPEDREVSLVVESTSSTLGAAEVTLQPAEPYDDPDPTDNTRTVTGLRPGTRLVLTSGEEQVHQQAGGGYPLSARVTGIRAGVTSVTLGLSGGLSFVTTSTPGCTIPHPTASGPAAPRLVCEGLEDGTAVNVTVASDTPARATAMTLTATPDSAHVDVGDQNIATVSLVPAYDFAMSDLTLTGHTVAADTDTYALTSTVHALPAGLDAVTFELAAGGTFAGTQDADCLIQDGTHVRCAGLHEDRRIAFSVTSTSTASHAASIRLLRPAGYDDPRSDDDAGAATGLPPGVDLHLADLRLAELDPEDESPSDGQHVVATALTGVRAGLDAVTYALSGDATFTKVTGDGCELGDRTVTCRHPGDGPVTFTLTSGHVRSATPVTIAAEPSAPFVETDASDNRRSTTLAPRPTYDFGIGALSLGDRTVGGGVDHLTVSTRLRAVPTGVPGVVLALSGGTFSLEGTGCARTDDTHVICDDLSTARSVRLRVDSASSTAHPLRLTIQAPRGYDDPDPGDDSATAQLTPGVDLALGPLTPADPVPTGGGYQVTGVLTGVRTGPVTLEVSGGATVAAASCPVTGATEVTCAAPTNGTRVSLTLSPDRPAARTIVTVRASAAGLEELQGADNSASASLAPDVTITSLTELIDGPVLAHVRVQVTGVPDGVSTVRLHLSGTGVGLGTGKVHLSTGAAGADGEGGVDCYTSDSTGRAMAEGVDLTCTRVTSASAGSFFIDTRLAHPHLSSRTVTYTIVPVGIDQGPHAANDSRDITVR
jgi:hypothetical protein